jgi:hypothetical protein
MEVRVASSDIAVPETSGLDDVVDALHEMVREARERRAVVGRQNLDRAQAAHS